MLKPSCAVYSLRLPHQQIQEHKSYLAAAVATANAASDRHSTSSMAGGQAYAIQLYKSFLAAAVITVNGFRQTQHILYGK